MSKRANEKNQEKLKIYLASKKEVKANDAK